MYTSQVLCICVNTISVCDNNSFGVNCTGVCNCNMSNIADTNQACNRVTGQCQCNPYWIGDICNKDVNECSVNRTICDVYQNRGCHNVIGGYVCDCLRGNTMEDGICVTGTVSRYTLIYLSIALQSLAST